MPAPLIAMRKSAKARLECSPETVESSMPSAAGLKKAVPVPHRAVSSIICHSWGSPARTRTANAACERQFRTLAATITRWRGSRSAMAPPMSRKRTSGSVRAAAISPTSPTDPPASMTAKAAAM